MASAYDHDWRAVRLSILDRDRRECQIRLDGCTKVATHVDHIHPLGEGGARLDPDNLRAACAFCNLARNARRSTILAAAFSTHVEAPGPSRKW